MNLVELSRNMYDVKVDGKVIGRIWLSTHDDGWHALTTRGATVGPRVGFWTKEDAAKAIVDAGS